MDAPLQPPVSQGGESRTFPTVPTGHLAVCHLRHSLSSQVFSTSSAALPSENKHSCFERSRVASVSLGRASRAHGKNDGYPLKTDGPVLERACPPLAVPGAGESRRADTEHRHSLHRSAPMAVRKLLVQQRALRNPYPTQHTHRCRVRVLQISMGCTNTWAWPTPLYCSFAGTSLEASFLSASVLGRKRLPYKVSGAGCGHVQTRSRARFRKTAHLQRPADTARTRLLLPCRSLHTRCHGSRWPGTRAARGQTLSPAVILFVHRTKRVQWKWAMPSRMFCAFVQKVCTFTSMPGDYLAGWPITDARGVGRNAWFLPQHHRPSTRPRPKYRFARSLCIPTHNYSSLCAGPLFLSPSLKTLSKT